MNQGLVVEGDEEFSVHFLVRTDFGVHVASDRVLQLLRAQFFWDVVSRHWRSIPEDSGQRCVPSSRVKCPVKKDVISLTVGLQRNVITHLRQHRGEE
jgi:hypothetical protein